MKSTLRIGSLSSSDRAIVLDMIVFAVPMELGLRCLNFRTLLNLIGRTRTAQNGEETNAAAKRASELVDAGAALYPFNATCLKKSLVLFWILQKRGIAAEFRLGVKKVDGRLKAHAWVECGGIPLLDGNVDDSFVVMPLRKGSDGCLTPI